jgi:hypothetical protein
LSSWPDTSARSRSFSFDVSISLIACSPSVDGFAGFCPATARFALALIDAGVEVQYLAPEFVAARHDPDPELGALYLQDNTCWTPRAAELAAKLVSDRVRRFPWFERGAADSKTPYLGKSKEREAWILREALRDVAVVWGGLSFETKRERFRVTRVLDPELRKVDFAHPSSPITLLSDEFAFFHNVNDCDFARQLFRHLETPIDAIHPFRGVEEGCRELADRSEKSKAKKELVIWMIPEHAFRPRSGWRKIDLFPPDSRPRRGR